MESLLEYTANKHHSLVRDYRTLNENNGESCHLIAIDIAQRLLLENKFPYISQIQGKVVDGIGNRERIIPKLFNGRVTWDIHIVCCADRLAYDPMISKEPVPIEDYPKKAFKGEIEMDPLFKQDQVREFIIFLLNRKFVHYKLS